MPMIKIQYDNSIVEKNEAQDLSEAIQEIVSNATGIEDVFVYTNSSEITVKIAPVEIFVEMSSHKIKNREELVKKIKDSLSEWKKLSSFPHPINFSLIPMDWNIEIGI